MPTAIYRYLTNDGFVIVADGKSRDLVKGVTASTTVQKIFEIPGCPAAYALYGNIRFDDEDNDESKSVNLATDLERFVRSQGTAVPHLLAYGERFSGPLCYRIIAAKSDGPIAEYWCFTT